MKLIYIYIQRFRNIERQEINLSDKFSVNLDGSALRIVRKEPNAAMDYMYGNSFMRDLHVIVGKTGSGKTNLLHLLGMDEWDRYNESKEHSYLMLYKKEAVDEFLAEIVNMEIDGFNTQSGHRTWELGKNQVIATFRYDYEHHRIYDARNAESKDREYTYVVNAFDRYSYANCPYEDKKMESIQEKDGFIPRMLTQMGRADVSLEYEYLKDYLAQFSEDSIKRRTSFVIKRDNWKDFHKFELDEDLMKSDYWTYESRLQEKEERNRAAGRRGVKATYPKGTTPKSRFIHDLMTDFAIYLRKWADCVDEGFPMETFDYWIPRIYDLGIEDPTELPDFEKISLDKRIDWLCQYIDFHTDEITGNKGLVWQAGSDVRDLYHILMKMDDRYFSDEEFSIPVMEIDLAQGSPMADLFERMGQYRPDEAEVFPQMLLPYHWTYVSSGEYQYAKVWGVIEEYGERLKLQGQGQKYEQALQPNILLLIDEPESYMHPEMCRTFISKMQAILTRRNPNAEFQVLMSTHSPFMLSDVLSDQVIKMDYDERGMCHITQSETPYFAANIHSIMADGFFLKYTIGEQARLFLTNKYELLNRMVDRKKALTADDRMEVENMAKLVPCIGDDMIRGLFSNLIKRITDL